MNGCLVALIALGVGLSVVEFWAIAHGGTTNVLGGLGLLMILAGVLLGGGTKGCLIALIATGVGLLVIEFWVMARGTTNVDHVGGLGLLMILAGVFAWKRMSSERRSRK